MSDATTPQQHGMQPSGELATPYAHGEPQPQPTSTAQPTSSPIHDVVPGQRPTIARLAQAFPAHPPMPAPAPLPGQTAQVTPVPAPQQPATPQAPWPGAYQQAVPAQPSSHAGGSPAFTPAAGHYADPNAGAFHGTPTAAPAPASLRGRGPTTAPLTAVAAPYSTPGVIGQPAAVAQGYPTLMAAPYGTPGVVPQGYQQAGAFAGVAHVPAAQQYPAASPGYVQGGQLLPQAPYQQIPSGQPQFVQQPGMYPQAATAPAVQQQPVMQVAPVMHAGPSVPVAPASPATSTAPAPQQAAAAAPVPAPATPARRMLPVPVPVPVPQAVHTATPQPTVVAAAAVPAATAEAQVASDSEHPAAAHQPAPATKPPSKARLPLLPKREVVELEPMEPPVEGLSMFAVSAAPATPRTRAAARARTESENTATTTSSSEAAPAPATPAPTAAPQDRTAALIAEEVSKIESRVIEEVRTGRMAVVPPATSRKRHTDSSLDVDSLSADSYTSGTNSDTSLDSWGIDSSDDDSSFNSWNPDSYLGVTDRGDDLAGEHTDTERDVVEMQAQSTSDVVTDLTVPTEPPAELDERDARYVSPDDQAFRKTAVPRREPSPAHQQLMDDLAVTPKWWRDAAEMVAWASLVYVVVLWMSNGGITNASTMGGAFTSLGRLTGLIAANLLLIQVILMARVPFLEASYSHGTLAKMHRTVGFTSFSLMVAHIGLILLGYAAGDPTKMQTALQFLLNKKPEVMLAAIGFILFLVVVGTSIARARATMNYGAWHFIHLWAYAGTFLAIPHQLKHGKDFTSTPSAQIYWLAAWGLAVLCVVIFRVALPLSRSLKHNLRVADVVVDDRGEYPISTITLTGHQLDKLPALPGQYMHWRFLYGKLRFHSNPYSLSATPDGHSLQITVAGVGSSSEELTRIPIGTKVWFAGPYGRLHQGVRTRKKVTLLAAGIGIAPMKALLEGLQADPGDITVIYRTHDDSKAPLLADVSEAAAARGANVYVLPGPRLTHRTSWLPEAWGNLKDDEALLQLVPDIAEHDVYVCGAPRWMSAAYRALRDAGVPTKHIHDEKFSY